MSMLTQWFFNILFSSVLSFSLCFLVFLQSLFNSQFVQGQLHLWFFDLFVFFLVSLSWFSNPTNQLRCVGKKIQKKKKKTENNQSLFSVVMNLLCFDYDKCWCCLDCFGLFLCTEWILFSGVKLLISRCVFFYRIQVLRPCRSAAVAWKQQILILTLIYLAMSSHLWIKPLYAHYCLYKKSIMW